jgi:hypothetical protein
VRDLWARYRPPSPALLRFSTVADENAAVDEFEKKKERLREVLRHLSDDDSWREAFAPSDHSAIERIRSILSLRIAGS